MKKYAIMPYELKWRIIGFLEAGKTISEASSFYKRPYSIIKNLLNKFNTTGTLARKEGSGPPIKYSNTHENQIIEELINNKTS